MGHAGAIVSGGDDTAEAKMNALKEIPKVFLSCKSVAEIGETMKNLLK